MDTLKFDMQKSLSAIGGEVRTDDDRPDGFIAGWASTDELDQTNEIISKNAFSASIQKAGLSGPGGIKLLLDHDPNKVAGRITKLEYRAKSNGVTGLWIEALLDLNISYARDRYYATKASGGLSFSVGYRVEKESDLSIDDKKGTRPVIKINKARLFEVSVVSNPANEGSFMLAFKSDSNIDWQVSASRDLPVCADASFDAKAAAERIFEAAGFENGTADDKLACKGFLLFNADAPSAKSSYGIPFADVVNGKLRAMPAGIKNARKMLQEAQISSVRKARANDILDGYEKRMRDAAQGLTLPRLKSMLVEEGWVKDEDTAENLMIVIKANLHIFETKKQDNGEQVRAKAEIARLITILESKETGNV